MIPQIPKRIIHVWGGGIGDLSLLSKAAVANVTLLNPDFDYMFFDDGQITDFTERYFPEYGQVFESFAFPIQRYDFFRYLAIYHFGGFYFDLDVFLARSLSDLLDTDCVFPFEELTVNKVLRQRYDMDWEIANYAFGAVKGHPFIRSIIENCVKAQKDPGWVDEMIASIPRILREEYRVYYTTGPGLVTRTLAEHQNGASQVRVLFPENVCDPTGWHRFGTYGVHLQKGTWRKKKSFLIRRIGSFWESRTRRELLDESLKLGGTRSMERSKKT